MDQEKLLKHWWVRALIVLGIWTLPGLVDASQSYLWHSLHNQPVRVGVLLVIGVSDWYVWALLTPLLVWMVRRYPLERPGPGRLMLHAVASICTPLLVISTGVPILLSLPTEAQAKQLSPADLFHHLVVGKFVFYVLTHWMIVGITHGLMYYRKYREHEVQALQLEAQLAQAQLQVLKLQLHPHFLFNTLNAISALIHRDVELADRMIARLGELLRGTLDNAGTQEVPLRQELEFVEPYLEIERARLGPRLAVRLDVDPATLDARVPNLLLQPLVDNAVRHGIAPKPAGGTIEVLSRREDGRLILQVRDSGAGLGPGPLREGVGLGNTRQRLRRLYGDQQGLDLGGGPAGGVTVTVTLPFREAEDGEASASTNGDGDGAFPPNGRPGAGLCKLPSER